MSPTADWLNVLDGAAATAAAEEESYRRDFARRVAELAERRAVAHRRANLMRAVAEGVALAEDEQAAVVHGLAILRTRLGWSTDSEARSEILARFAPVCEAAFAATTAGRSEAAAGEASEEGGVGADPIAALDAFESWYQGTKGSRFWILFENVMPETPLVDW